MDESVSKFQRCVCVCLCVRACVRAWLCVYVYVLHVVCMCDVCMRIAYLCVYVRLLCITFVCAFGYACVRMSTCAYMVLCVSVYSSHCTIVD